MCGIAGLVQRDGGAIGERGRVAAMMQSMARRGPDGAGLYCWPHAVLGHRRLAIFDLSEMGRQPMLSTDREIGVVFNGAIYNFVVLRRTLESSGYIFNSNTDTEVLIHGYLQWGIDGLVQRLHGMFAFGLWDNRRHLLFLVRDRLGVKPLFYSHKLEGLLAFASTADALLAGRFADSIDALSVLEYLEFGFIPEQESIYEGCEKLAPATILEWSADNNHAGRRCYWHPSTTTNPVIRFEDAVEQVEATLLNAVEMRLQADVPVGALLSGGVDSSLVCWAITKLGGEVTAYTIGAPGDPSDETADAIATARELGIQHEILNIGGELDPDLDELAAAFSEPFACASALGMLRVSKAIAGTATVLLTGDGGDDVFLGYPEHRNFLLAQTIGSSTPTTAASLWRALSRLLPETGRMGRLKYFLNYSTGGLGAVVSRRDGLPILVGRGALGQRLADMRLPRRDMPQSIEHARHLLDEFLAYDKTTRFVGEYLPKVDGGTMYHGIEARSSFLDQEMWEYASQLPYSVRMQGRRLKAVLRELAGRRIDPRVAVGKKRGFHIPVQDWLAGRWRPKFDDLLRASVLERDGWIDSSSVRRWLNEAAQDGHVPRQLWYIFLLEIWMRQQRENARSWHATTESTLLLALEEFRSSPPDKIGDHN